MNGGVDAKCVFVDALMMYVPTLQCAQSENNGIAHDSSRPSTTIPATNLIVRAV